MEPNNKNKRIFKLIRNIIIVVIALLAILGVLKIAPNYKNHEITDRTNLVINNNNITAFLKNDVHIEDGVVYLSRADVDNFFDPYIFYDKEEGRVVTTYDTNVATLLVNNPSITINDKEYTLSLPAITIDGILYLPFSLMENVYKASVKYVQSTDTVIVESESREKITASAKGNLSVKSKTEILSRTTDKVKKSEDVVIISKLEDGWVKVRTENGKIGYLLEKDLSTPTTVREAKEDKPAFDGTVNMVWDNFYFSVPDRTGTTIPGINVISPSLLEVERLGKGNVLEVAQSSAEVVNYMNWAHSNNYQVWPMVSNTRSESMMMTTTTEIMHSYELRSTLINNILNFVKKYNFDGINIDFEHMYDADIDLFTQFLVELHPRLKELNVVLSVDVTAPDGGENWSTCYNRNEIADNCDYIVFMAYDQYGNGSKTAGSTAAYDWVKVSLDKFLGREEVPAEKIILGLPFYTRIWKENSAGTIVNNDGNNIIDMKNMNRAVPNGTEKNWIEAARQYYVQYSSNGYTYKMWLEEERSLKEKLSLVTENKLGGASFWALGRESSSIWPIISNTLSQNSEN